MYFDFHKIFFTLSSLLFSVSLIAANHAVNSVSSSSDIVILSSTVNAIARPENPTVGNPYEYTKEEVSELEKILVVLVDSYGTQNYSKIVITDVDMELSILIAKDIFDKLPGGIYTVIASSANDLISQKLIIQ